MLSVSSTCESLLRHRTSRTNTARTQGCAYKGFLIFSILVSSLWPLRMTMPARSSTRPPMLSLVSYTRRSRSCFPIIGLWRDAYMNFLVMTLTGFIIGYSLPANPTSSTARASNSSSHAKPWGTIVSSSRSLIVLI